jgi:predicted membrane metal-binding protein
VRDAIFQRHGDRKLAGVVAALVTGDQNAIDRADWDVFRATGVAHLMSISGLHITMFAWVAAALVGGCGGAARACAWRCRRSTPALLGGLLLAAGYALFSGWGVPAQRTVWMLATVGAAAPGRAALALATWCGCWPARWWWRGPVGAAAAGLLAQLCRGGRAVCYRFRSCPRAPTPMRAGPGLP